MEKSEKDRESEIINELKSDCLSQLILARVWWCTNAIFYAAYFMGKSDKRTNKMRNSPQKEAVQKSGDIQINGNDDDDSNGHKTLERIEANENPLRAIYISFECSTYKSAAKSSILQNVFMYVCVCVFERMCERHAFVTFSLATNTEQTTKLHSMEIGNAQLIENSVHVA